MRDDVLCAARVRQAAPPLVGLGAIVGDVADMRGMDGGIWHERKGEHGKGAFLGELQFNLNSWAVHETMFLFDSVRASWK